MKGLERDTVRMAREKLGLTQEEFAEKLGILDKGTISRWERGEHNPPPDKLELMKKLVEEKTGVLSPMLSSTLTSAQPAVNSPKVLADSKAYPLDLTIGDGKIVLANPDDKGEAEIQADVEGQGKVRIDGSYLASVLRACNSLIERSSPKRAIKAKEP